MVVSKKTALLAREKGFNEKCERLYSSLVDNDQVSIISTSLVRNSDYTQCATAPSIEQLRNWIFDTTGKTIEVSKPIENGKTLDCFRYNITYSDGTYLGSVSRKLTELEAWEKAFIKVLNKIPADGLVTILAEFTIAEESAELCNRYFKELAKESLKEEGCIHYSVKRLFANDNTFVLYEVFRDKAAQEFHKTTPHVVDILRGRIEPLVLEKKVRFLI